MNKEQWAKHSIESKYSKLLESYILAVIDMGDYAMFLNDYRTDKMDVENRINKHELFVEMLKEVRDEIQR